MVLWGITTGRRVEADWLFRGGVAPLFPEQWDACAPGCRQPTGHEDIVEAYSRMLHDPDPAGPSPRCARLVHVGVGHPRLATHARDWTAGTPIPTSPWRSRAW